jgi:cytochrome P450
MADTTPAPSDVFAQVLDRASRPNPYPLYAQLRQHPVSRLADGTYLVSTYREIDALLHDPRISSDHRKSAHGAGALPASGRPAPEGRPDQPPFLYLDPPEHDRLRRLVVRQLTPARVESLRPRVAQLVDQYLDARRDRCHFDVVDELAYPLPITVVVAELLGVPREDEPRFHGWAKALARSLDPPQSTSEDEIRHAREAALQLREYLGNLVAAHRDHPTDDLLSGLIARDAPAEQMGEGDLLSTMALLLIAGHETTVNLITNGMLTLLRHPDALERLRRDPDLVIPLVEELQRFDPPVQFVKRTTLTDIDVAGVKIPRDAHVVLLFASGSRDPARFAEADRFIPDRADNAHLGFGGGLHYCVGAPVARLETHVALSTLARRLVGPRPVQDPPPYRDNAVLRGPEHLLVTFERLADGAPPHTSGHGR